MLHIKSLEAESFMLTGAYARGAKAFNLTCHLYNNWNFQTDATDIAQSDDAIMSEDEEYLMRKLNGSALEFGVDDYIKAWAGLAECLMNSGLIEEALIKFEHVKQKIENEIVFDKPILFINVCNQLGNCYLKTNDLAQAKKCFE